MLCRAGHVSGRRATEALEDLASANLRRYPHAPFRDRVWELRHELTAYDATYLALAEALRQSVLVTSDAALAERGSRLPGRRSRAAAGLVPSAVRPRIPRMQSKPCLWRADPYEVATARALARGLGVSPVVGAILARRGFGDLDEARRFLAADESHDPRTLPGAPEACELILRHAGSGSAIAVFGDYDVDGVCSTAMLLRTLRALGADPVWELPSRFDEGYGLSEAAVERLAGRGVRLLVTVDCGITAVEAVAAARVAGLDVIVTDHHRPGDQLPDCTVVHPALGGYGCPELCASGVVLKLSEALFAAAGRDPAEAAEDADLAALATVCDLVPLHGENRRIVREGLVALGRTRKPGLRALMEVGGVAPGELSEHALGFRLGPRINAAGRMQRADAAWSCSSPRTPRAPARWRASSTSSTAIAGRRRPGSCSPPRRPPRHRLTRRRSWWRARAGTRAWSGSWHRASSSAGAGRAW